jgi:hypothetical protein
MKAKGEAVSSGGSVAGNVTYANFRTGEFSSNPEDVRDRPRTLNPWRVLSGVVNGVLESRNTHDREQGMTRHDRFVRRVPVALAGVALAGTLVGMTAGPAIEHEAGRIVHIIDDLLGQENPQGMNAEPPSVGLPSEPLHVV